MPTLIVCGTPWCDLDNILTQLESAGLRPAESAAHGSITTIADWHQRLFAHRPHTAAPLQPGKAWDQAAGEIFLANWKHPLWGWADHRSTWLLDYWLQFDPDNCFVLVHTPAADALVAAALDTRQPHFDAAKTLDNWCAYQSHMLQFYLRHRDRCAWYPHLPTQPAQLGHGQAAQGQIADESAATALAYAIASNIADDIANAITTDSAATDISGALSDAITNASLTLQWPAAIDLTLAIPPKQAPQDAALGLLRTLAAQLVQKHEPATLLQSEIWASIPGLGEQPTALPTLQDDIAEVFNLAREVAVVQTHGMRQQLQEHSQAQQELKRAHREALQLKQQLDHLAQARDTEAQAKAALQAQLHTTEAERANLLQKQEQLTQSQQALQAKMVQTTRLQNDANEENELLLLQLHQVQEELENYFLRHQEAQQHCQQLQKRLARWSQRYPDACEWDTVAVLPHTQPHQQDLLITQFQHGSRSLAQLHVQLQHSKQQHKLVLLHGTGQPTPLLRWPQATGADGSTAPASSLTLDLRAQPHTPAGEALAQLAPSDLQMLTALCRAIAAHLPSQPPDAAAWANHWQATANALAALPPGWRYDQLSLRHEQVNPDYEHLWLHFDNAQYAQRRWPSFEFRLSASNVRKQGFSHLPKLEFPLPEAHLPKPFEHWLEESEDDKGPKFELRFDIKTPALDVNNWHALSPQDQAQALELVRQLPQFLQQLEQAGTTIHRPWSDWHGMADGIRHALTQCLGIVFDAPATPNAPATPSAPPASPPAEPATAPAPAAQPQAPRAPRSGRASPSRKPQE